MHPIQEQILKLFESHQTIQFNLRQIGRTLGEEYPEKIKHHLKQLEKKGFIKIDRDKGIISTSKAGAIKDSDLVAIPIVGSANCGEATIVADEFLQGYLKVSRSFVGNKKKLIAIKASGNSMNRANIQGKSIETGDYVIINCDDKLPRDGDYVLSVIDGLANIKKFVKDEKNNQIILVSESTENYPPIFINPFNYDYLINGKVLNVLKIDAVNRKAGA